MNYTSIGDISNNYGGLLVTEYEGKYYWIIGDYDIDFENLEEWEEISKDLYDNLIVHEDKISLLP